MLDYVAALKDHIEANGLSLNKVSKEIDLSYPGLRSILEGKHTPIPYSEAKIKIYLANKKIPIKLSPVKKELATGKSLQSIVIDKNIPIPETNGKSLYPYDIMEVGDSFLVDDENKINTFRSAASYYGSKTNKKYTFRKHNGGYRCWRVK